MYERCIFGACIFLPPNLGSNYSFTSAGLLQRRKKEGQRKGRHL